MTGDVTLVLIGHGLSFLSFLALFVLVAIGRRPSPFRATILMAAAGTCVWSAFTIATSLLLEQPVMVPLLEWVGIGGWVWLTGRLLSAASPERAAVYVRLSWLGLGLPLGMILLLTFASLAGIAPFSLATINLFEAMALIGMIVFGLVLVETLARWMGAQGRIAARFYFLSIGVLLSVDLFLFATILLLGRIDSAVYEARGLILAFVPPLMAVALARQRDWLVDIHVSRQVVVNAATLLGVGVYLLSMAIAGFAVRELNTSWGPALHVTFLAGSVILLGTIVSSQSLRPNLMSWVSRNFFSAKYDYRQEWLRFSGALSANHGGASVEQRVLDAILSSLSCRSGGLWLVLEGEAGFALAAARPGEAVLRDVDVSALAKHFGSHEAAVALKPGSPSHEELTVPGSFKSLWAGVPIRHRSRLIGILVLAEPMVSRVPDAEDLELLTVLSVQAAGHLAEMQSAAALGRTQRFESTARRLTYIGHDLKNIVSQISLVLQNWSRHGDNPAFIRDLPNVLGSAVVRMKGLLEGLKAGAEGAETVVAPVDLSECILAMVKIWRARHPDVRVDIQLHNVFLLGRYEQIQSIFDQLVSNAIEASGGSGEVLLRAHADDLKVTCEIQDAGTGISELAVSGSRFDTTDSSKVNGFGVGLFQIRDYVRRLGGSLEFFSAPGEGTTARLTFPLFTPGAELVAFPNKRGPAVPEALTGLRISS